MPPILFWLYINKHKKENKPPIRKGMYQVEIESGVWKTFNTEEEYQTWKKEEDERPETMAEKIIGTILILVFLSMIVMAVVAISFTLKT